MDEATEALLRDLETSPTDLRKLVVNTLWRNRSEVAIESEAIARWTRDDPHRWASVQAWLAAQGITITILVLKDRAGPGAARATRSVQWRPPPPGTAQA